MVAPPLIVTDDGLVLSLADRLASSAVAGGSSMIGVHSGWRVSNDHASYLPKALPKTLPEGGRRGGRGLDPSCEAERVI